MSQDDTPAATGPGTQRLDKWLWYTRIVKSRTLAAGLVGGGKVRLNRERVDKPSHVVRVGDVVTATVHRQIKVLRVLALGDRRGPAVEARLLYEDLSEPEPKPSAETSQNAGDMPSPDARPDKRDRRKLAEWKRRGT